MYKKFLLVLISLVAFTSNLFCKAFNDFELKTINDLQNLRMELRAYKSSDESLKILSEYEANLKSDEIQNQLGEEAKYLLDIILVWENYNWKYEIDPKSKELEKTMINLFNKAKSRIEENKNGDINPWVYSSTADITSSSLQYLSMGDAMKEGLNVKKYYEEALKKDSNFAWGTMNLAQWYFHAPGFAGGGNKNALPFFEKALTLAKTPSEKFFASLFLSQSYYELKEKDKCLNLLNSIEEITPDSSYIKFIKKLNDAGYSLFYYTVNRDKVEEKLNKKK